MAKIPPVVRYFIPCENVIVDSEKPNQHTFVNIISSIRVVEEPAFPFLYEEMCIYLQLTECRGSGTISFDVVHSETEACAYEKKSWPVKFGKDPLEIKGLIFRLHDLEFPVAGLYWLRFWFDKQVLEEKPLLVKGT